MGLLDMFRRRPDTTIAALEAMHRTVSALADAQAEQAKRIVALFEKGPDQPTKADWLRIGQLEADVQSMTAQWADYKDTFNRLILRFEKRDERAAKKPDDGAQLEIVEPVRADPDPITTRVLERRRRGAAFKPGAGNTAENPNIGR